MEKEKPRSSKKTANTVIISGTVVGKTAYGFNQEYETNELKFMLQSITFDADGKAYSSKELCKLLGDAAVNNQDLAEGMKVIITGRLKYPNRLKYPKDYYRGFVQGYELDRM